MLRVEEESPDSCCNFSILQSAEVENWSPGESVASTLPARLRDEHSR
jgi:hypothetical protein